MVHLLISLAVTCVMYNLSTALAYRGSAWPGPGQGAPYPDGGYPHRASSWSGCCPWTPPTHAKFTPAPSGNSPSDFSTPKWTTPPLRRNAIPRAECRDGDKVYKPGDRWTPTGGCGRQSCTTDGKTTVLGCPPTEPRSSCTTSAPDPRHPWPFCCPRLDCT